MRNNNNPPHTAPKPHREGIIATPFTEPQISIAGSASVSVSVSRIGFICAPLSTSKMDIFDSSSVKRKRSNTNRRPRPENQNQSVVSNRKEISLNQFDDEHMVRKVKLKLGGVTRTIHPSPSRPRPKLILQDTSDDDDDDDHGHGHGHGGMDRSLTTRQRALQSAQRFVEFPDGLPPVLPRKQKEKASEVEQELKKAEAAQRRRMQVEKAARESEAEAIRKILGQDSSRKKREDRNKKRRDEIAQEKAANALTLPPNTIRWAISPTGTVVTFPPEMGLPSIFSSKPCSYPPPREKCAAPLCTNAYKYRDSKSNLPLCSLHCYKAVNGWVHPVSTF